MIEWRLNESSADFSPFDPVFAVQGKIRCQLWQSHLNNIDSMARRMAVTDARDSVLQRRVCALPGQPPAL
jgi:hypothetical protein